MISFSVSREEMELILKIAQRAKVMAADYRIEYLPMESMMDLSACIAQGVPLKLRELLNADDENFAHDVFGIRRHINRETGRLENCFLPRYNDLPRAA